MRWVGEFIGFPATGGAFTSGGTISNVTRARGGARAGPARAHGHEGLSRAPRRRLLLGRGPLLGHAGGGAARASARTTCATLPIDGAAPDAPGRARRGDRRRRRRRRRAGRRRGDRRHHADGRDRPDRRRSPTCATSAACGSTSTARTGCRRQRCRVTRAVRRARARRLVLGRRPQVAVPAEGMRRRAGARARRRARRGRSRTSRATCRTSSTSCTPSTSRSSTRGRSGR